MAVLAVLTVSSGWHVWRPLSMTVFVCLVVVVVVSVQQYHHVFVCFRDRLRSGGHTFYYLLLITRSFDWSVMVVAVVVGGGGCTY